MAKPTFLKLSDGKRKQIRDAALDEFSKHPYSLASISKIVRSAGISKGSVYQYFDDKFGLYKWLIKESLHLKLKFVSAEAPKAGEFLPWLEAQFKAGFRFAQAHPRLARLGLSFRDPNPEAGTLAARFRESGLGAMQTWIEEAQSFGEIRDDLNARLLASLIMSTQTSIFDILCSMTDVRSPDELFAKKRLAELSEEALDEVVHGVMSVFGQGVRSPKKIKIKAGAQHSPLDIDAIIEDAFRTS